ncbi:MAG TPA: nucleoside transporter [Candidatus Hydrogenedens sp.]|nr:nucleoside transporter [Candidatus Hydrogenedens sp.]HOL19115.1 nucleoside transporter [Candidatus Hydrogenedens sp.]HPP58067.1 nucleoside transporter [Candidatus Hydrogenedens sp.]
MSETPILKPTQALDLLYEFEREPVTEDKLQPGRYFAGLFAGEHVAGTEFVIGALFVSWGVNAYDIFVGLLLGNLMAVLTWTLICAPIAVRTRLTLYWFLRKVAGPTVTTIYNVLNAFLFCILAGCMITVSASAVRVPLGIPPQTQWIPTDFRFVLVVLVVGAVVVTLAILGFKRLSQFSVVCSPWMFLMFIAGAIALLPAAGVDIRTWNDFWQIATQKIWTGVRPDGKEPISFWHVSAFAWICNLAMHGGLSDMAIFRYARSSAYGLFSAFGMFLGHYLAWICAGIMGAMSAILLQKSIIELDSGAVATEALGTAGLIAVILAGWTTSNPTLYRAGLALQAVTPGWPRWLVTLLAGAGTTIIACSPFVFTKLLDFVGYYGLLLMPLGAVAFTEYWIFPKIGLTRYWIEKKQMSMNLPALLSWLISIAVAITLEKTGTLHLFFLFVPVWLMTSILYTILAMLMGARDVPADAKEVIPTAENNLIVTSSQRKKEITQKEESKSDPVVWISGIIAGLSLIICLLLSIWVFVKGTNGFAQNLKTFHSILLYPTLAYFIAGTIFVIRRDREKQNN